MPFVVLLSRGLALQTKEGVPAEIDRAQAIRKQLGDRQFIIPVRIDNVPYEDLPPMLGNRMALAVSAAP